MGARDVGYRNRGWGVKDWGSSSSKSQNFLRLIGVLFVALIALDQERPANRHRFEGVRFAERNLVSEHHVRFLMGLLVLANDYPKIATISLGIPPRKRAPCSRGVKYPIQEHHGKEEVNS